MSGKNEEELKAYLHKITAPKKEEPKQQGGFVLLVALVLLTMIAIANCAPRNATPDIPQQERNGSR